MIPDPAEKPHDRQNEEHGAQGAVESEAEAAEKKENDENEK